MTFLFAVVLLSVYTVFVYRLGIAVERTKEYEKQIKSVSIACDVRNNADIDKLRKKYRNG